MVLTDNIPQQSWLTAEESTKLLLEAVPVTAALQYKYLSIKKGYCKAVLPLHKHSANQHGTHQGLLLGVAADYTGGIALASIIDNEPVLGIHNISNEKGMCLWLAKQEITYLRPSVEDVFLESVIDPMQHEVLENRYHSGGTILLDVDVRLFNKQDETVAKGVFRYYCKKKTALQPGSAVQKADSMHAHLLKTNAKLLAQLRYLETQKEKPLFTDETAAYIAGQQGQLMAERFLTLMPDLQNFVAARVFHLTQTITQHAALVKQVVFIGTGLDFHIYRNKNLWKGMAVFEMDIAAILEERQRFEAVLNLQNANLHSLTRIKTSVFFDDLAEKLLLNGCDVSQPVLFIYEGSSMYMPKDITSKVLDEVSLLMQCNSNSLLWMDLVEEKMLNNQQPEVTNFINSMAKLGKPICSGFSASDDAFSNAGLQMLQQTYAASLVQLAQPQLAAAYSFALLGCMGSSHVPAIKNVVSKNRQAFEQLISKSELKTAE
jgi:methyltransferase (TIGR00027 family)